MIDFKNPSEIKRRVIKHKVDEGDFFTLSISALEKEEIYENNKDKSEEELIVIVLSKILCDEKGELINLSIEDLKALPDALFKDMIKACMGMVIGEKKS